MLNRTEAAYELAKYFEGTVEATPIHVKNLYLFTMTYRIYIDKVDFYSNRQQDVITEAAIGLRDRILDSPVFNKYRQQIEELEEQLKLTKTQLDIERQHSEMLLNKLGDKEEKQPESR